MFDFFKKIIKKKEPELVSPVPLGTRVAPAPDWDRIRNEIARKKRLELPVTPTPTIVPQFRQVRPKVQEEIRKTFKENPNEAINVAAMESSLNPSLIQQEGNPYVPELGRKSRDIGLYQINEWWQRKNLKKAGYTPEDMFNLQKNLSFTKWLQQRQGWQPWHGARNVGL